VSTEDDKCSGRPSSSKTTENVEKCWEIIHKNRHWTIHELTDTVGISLPRDLNRKFEHPLHCCAVCSLTIDKWPKAAASKRVLSYDSRLMRTQLLSLGS
jgi:hypothetical protein